MKWENKGHELGEYAEKLLAMLNTRKRYYIFGAGLLGKNLLIVLRAYGCMVTFIDNDKSKQGSKIEGIDIVSLEDYLKAKDGLLIW